MFRTMYDTDVTVWSPQGRLLQVEYAMEAVKQGSACLGIVGSKYVVLAALKRSPHDLAAYQKKLLKIDDHVGVAIAGLCGAWAVRSPATALLASLAPAAFVAIMLGATTRLEERQLQTHGDEALYRQWVMATPRLFFSLRRRRMVAADDAKGDSLGLGPSGAKTTRSGGSLRYSLASAAAAAALRSGTT